MNAGIDNLYYYKDKSDLRKAWDKYYTEMGLSYTKKLKKVIERVRKGKFPQKQK